MKKTVSTVRGVVRLAAVSAALGMFGLPFTASAAFIDGQMTFSGDIEPTGGTDLSDATGLLFPNLDFGVDAASGDLGSILPGDTGTINNFSFAPLLPNPVDPLLSIGGFDYVLETVAIVFQSDMALIIEGSGTLSGTGFDDTAYDFNLTANMVTGELSNFSASIGPTAVVPVPGAVLLLGSALAGLGLLRRRPA